MNDQELQNLKATVARLETAIEITNRGERVSLAGARRHQRRALWIGTAGLCLLPIVGWAAVELTTFQKGDPISSSDVNANFAGVAAAISARENLQFSQVAAAFTCSSATPCISEDLEVAITTDGSRAVRVELVAADASQAYINLDNAAGGQTDIQSELMLQRSTDGGDWEDVYATSLRYVDDDAAAGTLQVPVGVVAFIDRTAGAGEHAYRLVTRIPIAGPVNLTVNNARLAASDAGVLP